MSLGRVVGNRGLRHNFPIFDVSRYNDKPWFLTVGTRQANNNVEYGADIFPTGDNTELPSEATVRALAEAITGESIMVLDLETYPMGDSNTDGEIDDAVDKLVTVVGWAKDERPDLAIGYYALAPMRDFWRAVNVNPTYAEWQRQNDLIQPLADAVDFLAPSLYTFYPQAQGSGLHWSAYITENISEARRLADGKPVYPFMWPQYHPGGVSDYEFIEGSYWRDQLELVSELADGMMFWGHNSLLPAGGMEYGDWWEEMQDFIAG